MSDIQYTYMHDACIFTKRGQKRQISIHSQYILRTFIYDEQVMTIRK